MIDQSKLDLRAVEAAEAANQYAESAAAAAHWGAIISGVGLFALLVTIFVSFLALGRAREANEIARNTSKQQLRAYVTFQKIEQNLKLFIGKGRKIEITPIFQNSGQTPTKNLVFSTSLHKSIPENERDIKLFFDNKIRGISLGADQSTWGPSLFISEEDAIAAFKSNISYYMHTGASYCDVFGDERVHESFIKLDFRKHGDVDIPNYIEWEIVGPNNNWS